VNCQQAGKLLPLYAGGDLDQKREQLVAAHVQLCATCAAEVVEFHTTGRLLQELTLPVIRDGAYDEIRRQVWQRIESDSAGPRVPWRFAGWFQPRAAWAAATIVVIAIMLTAIYVISNRRGAPRSSETEIAGHNQKSDGPTASNSPVKQSEVPVKLKAGSYQGRGARRIRHFGQPVPANAERGSLAANASVASSVTVKPRFEKSSSDSTAEPGLKDIRMEIQTSNPNIRIIWLSQPESKRSPNTKGT